MFDAAFPWNKPWNKPSSDILGYPHDLRNLHGKLGHGILVAKDQELKQLKLRAHRSRLVLSTDLPIIRSRPFHRRIGQILGFAQVIQKKWIFPIDSPSNVVKTMSCLPPKTGNGLYIPPTFLVKLGMVYGIALPTFVDFQEKKHQQQIQGKKEPEPIRWLQWWWCSSGFWLRYMLSNVHYCITMFEQCYVQSANNIIYSCDQCCIEYDNWICIVCILGYKNRSVVTASSCLLYQVLRSGRVIDLSPSVGQTQIPSGELT